jgi:hypothetical protein
MPIERAQGGSLRSPARRQQSPSAPVASSFLSFFKSLIFKIIKSERNGAKNLEPNQSASERSKMAYQDTAWARLDKAARKAMLLRAEAHKLTAEFSGSDAAAKAWRDYDEARLEERRALLKAKTLRLSR